MKNKKETNWIQKNSSFILSIVLLAGIVIMILFEFPQKEEFIIYKEECRLENSIYTNSPMSAFESFIIPLEVTSVFVESVEYDKSINADDILDVINESVDYRELKEKIDAFESLRYKKVKENIIISLDNRTIQNINGFAVQVDFNDTRKVCEEKKVEYVSYKDFVYCDEINKSEYRGFCFPRENPPDDKIIKKEDLTNEWLDMNAESILICDINDICESLEGNNLKYLGDTDKNNNHWLILRKGSYIKEYRFGDYRVEERK